MSEPADFPERAFQAAQNLLKKGAEVARQQTRAVRLQTQVSRLREEKRKLYSAMGQKVYALFQKDLVRNADLRLLCQQITKLDSEIGIREEELDQLRRHSSRRDVEGGVDAEETPGDLGGDIDRIHRD
jgi:hypothetical protein